MMTAVLFWMLIQLDAPWWCFAFLAIRLFVRVILDMAIIGGARRGVSRP